MRTFPSGSRASSRRRQVDYHSLIIENYLRRFHWLVCKKDNNMYDVWVCVNNNFLSLVRRYSNVKIFAESPYSWQKSGIRVNPCIILYIFRFKFHWLSAKHTTDHYLNQWWSSDQPYTCVTRPRWLNTLKSEQNGQGIFGQYIQISFLKGKWSYFVFSFPLSLFLSVQITISQYGIR